MNVGAPECCSITDVVSVHFSSRFRGFATDGRASLGLYLVVLNSYGINATEQYCVCL